MQIRTILYQYIKTLFKHVFLLNFTYELLMTLEVTIYVVPSELYKYWNDNFR